VARTKATTNNSTRKRKLKVMPNKIQMNNPSNNLRDSDSAKPLKARDLKVNLKKPQLKKTTRKTTKRKQHPLKTKLKMLNNQLPNKKLLLRNNNNKKKRKKKPQRTLNSVQLLQDLQESNPQVLTNPSVD
jgi:hypothetical protein